jgi:L-asparaginase
VKIDPQSCHPVSLVEGRGIGHQSLGHTPCCPSRNTPGTLASSIEMTTSPHIKIITTGGTIDKIYFDARSEYEVGPPQIMDILSEARATFAVEVDSILSKDSLDLTEEDRRLIRHKIEAESCARIVVTHGTDTMIHTACMLQGIAGKTIVLTGSLQPARFKGTDASFNVGVAIGAVQVLPPGVYIAMGGQVFDPEKVRKNVAACRFEAI